MTELLAVGPGDRVLDVGTGSGYQAAILAELGCRVTSIERERALAAEASERLARLGYADRVTVTAGDGSLGLPDGAPWDGILVAAAAPRIPEALRDQLGDGRRLVIPVGSRREQLLLIVERHGSEWTERSDGACVFVPLIGAEGWRAVTSGLLLVMSVALTSGPQQRGLEPRRSHRACDTPSRPVVTMTASMRSAPILSRSQRGDAHRRRRRRPPA